MKKRIFLVWTRIRHITNFICGFDVVEKRFFTILPIFSLHVDMSLRLKIIHKTVTCTPIHPMDTSSAWYMLAHCISSSAGLVFLPLKLNKNSKTCRNLKFEQKCSKLDYFSKKKNQFCRNFCRAYPWISMYNCLYRVPAYTKHYKRSLDVLEYIYDFMNNFKPQRHIYMG